MLEKLAMEGWWEWDPPERRWTMSPRMLEILGVPAGQAADYPAAGAMSDWIELIHPDDRPGLAVQVSAHLQGDALGVQLDCRLHRADGAWCWVRLRAASVEQGDQKRWVGCAVDVDDHRRTQEILGASQQWLDLVLDASRIGFWDWDIRRGQRVYFSHGYKQMLGYEPGEIEDTWLSGWHTLVHPDDVAEEERSARAHMAGQTSYYDAQYRMRHKDGRWRWVHARGRIILRDASGEPLRWVGVHTDITEIRQAEQALRQSERRYRSVVQCQTEMICRFLPDTTLTFVNEAYARFFGRRPDQLVGRSFLMLVPEQEHDGIRRHLRSLTPGSPMATYEHQVFSPDGRACWQQWTDQAFFNERGEPVELQAVGRDITHRHEAEQALRASEQRYRGLVDSLEEMIVRIRLDRTLTFVNAAFCRMMDKTPQDLLWRALHLEIHPDDLEHARSAEREIHRPPHRVTVDIRQQTAEGWRWINWQCLALLNDRQEIDEIQAVGRDMTRHKQDQAEQRHRLLALAHVARLNTAGKMASNLAHEISQPLTALLNFAHAARRRLEAGQASPDLVAEALEQIVLQGERAGQIVQGVREFVGRHVSDRQVISFPSAVERAVRFVAAEALRNRVHLQVKCCSTPCQVLAEVSQVEQVLVNLLLNAMDAMHDTPGKPHELTLIARRQPRAVEVRVSDTGPGVDEANRERIFEPFFTTKSHGMGLGLSISRSIIEDHGGRMWVEANDRGGATFCFTLPLPPPARGEEIS
ncbi:MAG: PAS domain-containing protein [Phycisphaeraceae bacterium]|nr:PAS domain-containing protein [Phycisphaeraceae bacterium]